MITAEGDLCPSKSFWYSCKHCERLCFLPLWRKSFIPQCKSRVDIPTESRLKSSSSLVLNQGHLKEQSVHRRQMETISSPLENSQSGKGHICFYFPRHSLGENCSRATWCAYGKFQLARGTPRFCCGCFCGHPKWQWFWETLSTSGFVTASTPLPSLPTDLWRSKQYGLS